MPGCAPTTMRLLKSLFEQGFEPSPADERVQIYSILPWDGESVGLDPARPDAARFRHEITPGEVESVAVYYSLWL